ncbi:hypothetical protein UA38_19875 [Photobacterium kishitanii]|uniref:Adenylate kinase n=1 Tax=Photobacterium kishitanii TaxID=318456 RepID=A0AAX0YSK7_9GAMM|nr:hypothetical protein [Photobacterium kishitanii]KJG55395.1 hypothetical protein UA38_19875 [Photobacterium kishitanii]KJG57001.1 hypothetical protein UA42_21920 [Photobacterium kishitanii]KJG63458.1 hypothetical protein UA40_21850 [Photobacterium kishitanii]KJG66551.1 hypothetical protein UA41_20630 [Photobacterium kishitanii]PSX18236.1 hypothetical protein C0W70_15285 [Photobacterium kishitanii]
MKINWLKCFFRNKLKERFDEKMMHSDRKSKELDKDKFSNNYPQIANRLEGHIQTYNTLFLVDTKYTQEIAEVINEYLTTPYELKKR